MTTRQYIEDYSRGQQKQVTNILVYKRIFRNNVTLKKNVGNMNMVLLEGLYFVPVSIQTKSPICK